MNSNEFNLSDMIKEIPVQFDKVISEMTKTAEMIGKAIKENLDDATDSKSDDTPAQSSVDMPSADDAPESSADKPEMSMPVTNKEPAEKDKSFLNLEDMVTLLEVNDALEELNHAMTVIVGDIGIGSDGLMSELDKVSSLIAKLCPVSKPADDDLAPNEWIYELLEDKTVDNERKARILLGLEEQ